MTRPLMICTEHSAAELRRLARQEPDRRAAMRQFAIAGALEGLPRPEAARAADMSDQALRDAIKRFNVEGLDGLHDRPRSGRPCKTDAEQRRELCETVRAGPDVEAEGVSAYTRDDGARIAREKWNVVYHPTSIGRILRAGGLSRQKARPSHPKKDAEAAEAFKKGARANCENRQ
jgi:transposase